LFAVGCLIFHLNTVITNTTFHTHITISYLSLILFLHPAKTAKMDTNETQQIKRPSIAFSNEEPAVKKAAVATDIAMKMTLSKKCNAGNDNKEDVLAVMEGAVEQGEDDGKVQWHLCQAQGVQSIWWNHFMKFNPLKHKNNSEKVACNLCFESHCYTRGTVSCKAGNTSGMKRHFMTHHRKEYEAMQVKKPSSDQAKKAGSINRFYPLQQKDYFFGIEDIKRQFKVAVASWVVQEAVPISMVEAPSFRNMFEPFNKKASEITNVNRHTVREEIMTMGRYAWKATEIEMTGREVAWTTDHWTGPNDETYSTVTSHFINDNWTLESCCLDFKVFTGTTSGEAIYNDIHNVLNQFQGDSTIVLDTIGITDTTGNMGKLGQYCRDNGRRHGYCTDHNFHRNAIKAFSRESI
jgi:hypothetical protein